MSIFKIARFQVRPEARDVVEQAMREFAAYVAFELPDSSWVTYRDRAHPDRYVSLITGNNEAGTEKFVDVLAPNLVGAIELTDYEPVASSKG